MKVGTKNKPLIAHLAILGSCIGWGLMAPICKDAMLHGVDAVTMVTFRVTGACLLFWIASCFAPKEVDGRSEHHIAYQREHRNNHDAYLCHAVVSTHTEGAHYWQEGAGRVWL